jgi:Tfp pilus assembly protein PilN
MALQKREKRLLVLVMVAIAVLLFDRFFYAPQQRKVMRLKEEAKMADRKLQELTLLAQGLEASEAEITRLEEELKSLSGRTLRGEEFRAFLRHLARQSDPLQMKIVSVVPSEEKVIPSAEKKGTMLADFRRVTVQLVLHSTFSRLESYLRGIEELPFLVRVEGLQIERNEEAHPLLKATLKLRMFIIPTKENVQ